MNSLNYDMTPTSLYKRFLSHFSIREPVLVNPSPASSVDIILKAISDASIDYVKKHSRPPVLIIDQINTVAKGDPTTFTKLVKFAKMQADHGHLVIVFVASEGNAPRQISRFSERSRLAPVIEIGDLDNQSAQQFLRRSNIDNAEDIVNVTGGRMIFLKTMTEELTDKSLEDIRNYFIEFAIRDFALSQLLLPASKNVTLDNRRFNTWDQLVKIHDSPTKSVKYVDFLSQVGESMGDELLSQNIFSYQHNAGQVSFQSKPVELFVREKIGERGSDMRKIVEEALFSNKKGE